MNNVLTVLGCDAGNKNFGYSVVSFRLRKGSLKYKIRECGVLNNTLTQLTQGKYAPQLENFKEELYAKIDKYKVGHIMAERFMPRGRFGNTSEYVNIMIGYLLAQRVRVNLVTAATWKNKANTFLGKGGLDLLYKVVETPDHELDATLQAMYLAEELLEFPVYEKTLSTQRDRLRLLNKVSKWTTSKRINRKSTLAL